LDRPKEKRIVVHRTAATWLVVRGRGSERWAADALVVLTRESQVEVVVAYCSGAIASRIAANTPVGTLSHSAEAVA
jgi:hypothetical protein